MPNVLEADGLGKAYRVYSTRWHRLAEWLDPRGRGHHAPYWVLRNCSFSVPAGQSVGIVGRNGAGKSTLLKLITGITTPTEGRVRTSGRVAALLELGMGFHGEFSGRQNVLLAGQLLGFSVEELAAQIEPIQRFAELGDYFDRPLRSYSSGMQMRLAFAVATAVRPDLLIVDEALAVGDAYFQHKCFRRIREFREQGTSLLFVSHDAGAVINLCDRAILLENGEPIRDGNPREVFEHYSGLIAAQEGRQAESVRGEGVSRYGDGQATISRVVSGGEDGERSTLIAGEPAWIEVAFRVNSDLPDLTLGIMIRDRLGNDIFGTNTHHLGFALEKLAVGSHHTVRLDIERLALGPGDYHLTVALHAASDHVAGNFDWWDAAHSLKVLARPGYPFAGVAELCLTPRLVAT